MSILGSYIKKKRESLNSRYSGYSIRSLAQKIGIHHSFLSKLERGETDTLSERRIMAISRVLEEDPDILMALNGKLSSNACRIVQKNPVRFVELLRKMELDDLEEASEGDDFYTRRLEARKSELEEMTRRLRQEMKERREAVKALEESEARHRAIFEKNSVAQMLVDPDNGDIIDANPAACNFYGYDRKTMSKMNMAQISELTSEELKFAIHQAAIHDRTVFRFPHKTACGRTVSTETSSTMVPYHGRKVLHSIIIDITSRRQLQESLQREATIKDAMARASQALLGEAFQLKEVSMIVLDKARELTGSYNGLVIFQDESTKGAQGFSSGRQISKNPVYPENQQSISIPLIPDSNGKFREFWCESLNTGQSFYSNEPGPEQSVLQMSGIEINLHNFLSVPVIDHGTDRITGALFLANSYKKYRPEDMGVVKDLALLYSLALHRLTHENS